MRYLSYATGRFSAARDTFLFFAVVYNCNGDRMKSALQRHGKPMPEEHAALRRSHRHIPPMFGPLVEANFTFTPAAVRKAQIHCCVAAFSNWLVERGRNGLPLDGECTSPNGRIELESHLDRIAKMVLELHTLEPGPSTLSTTRGILRKAVADAFLEIDAMRPKAVGQSGTGPRNYRISADVSAICAAEIAEGFCHELNIILGDAEPIPLHGKA
jgi:hypothetical protein